jgi:hypothetical protein
MDKIKIVIINETNRTTLVVRKVNKQSKLGIDDIIDFANINYEFNTTESSENILKKNGLEKVPFTELVPKFKQIKPDDTLILNKEICNICHDHFNIKEYKRELRCKHTFHKKCIDKWLKKHPNCPNCREDIFL